MIAQEYAGRSAKPLSGRWISDRVLCRFSFLTLRLLVSFGTTRGRTSKRLACGRCAATGCHEEPIIRLWLKSVGLCDRQLPLDFRNAPLASRPRSRGAAICREGPKSEELTLSTIGPLRDFPSRVRRRLSRKGALLPERRSTNDRRSLRAVKIAR